MFKNTLNFKINFIVKLYDIFEKKIVDHLAFDNLLFLHLAYLTMYSVAQRMFPSQRFKPKTTKNHKIPMIKFI